MDSYSLLIIILSVAFSAFFSGMELAFVSANKLRIELENKQGIFSSRLISNYFLSNPSRYIGTMLVGNNIMLVIYGIFMAAILDAPLRNYFHSNAAVLVAQTILSTLVILVTGEFLPKALFRINPNKTLSIFVVPALFFYFTLYILVGFIIGISEFMLKKIFRIELPEGRFDFSRIDLNNLVKEATDSKPGKDEEEIDHEIQIFQNALDFPNIRVRECMIPRTEIIATEVNDNMEELRKKLIETGVSKILIYKETIDNIIGYVHSYEMFKKPESIKSVLLPVLIVPETMPAQEALSRFIQERKSMAVVVDEFGGTSGLLTMEDVMEEIFGDIEDEHDIEEFEETRISDSEYVFSGRLEVDYINDEYDLELPVGEDYETLAGLIISNHGSIPSRDEVITIGDFRFTIMEVSDKRIERVKVKVVD